MWPKRNHSIQSNGFIFSKKRKFGCPFLSLERLTSELSRLPKLQFWTKDRGSQWTYMDHNIQELWKYNSGRWMIKVPPYVWTTVFQAHMDWNFHRNGCRPIWNEPTQAFCQMLWLMWTNYARKKTVRCQRISEERSWKPKPLPLKFYLLLILQNQAHTS